MKLILIAVVLLAFTACGTGPDTEFVARVIDGDTFVLKTREIVRIYDIDAPEMDTPEGQGAALVLQGLIEHTRVIITRISTDRYGRTLACVEDVGQIMIDAGHARPWIGATCN